jgi:multidrug resistance efflux pump
MSENDRVALHRVARRLGKARESIRLLRRQLFEARRELEQSQRAHQDVIDRLNRYKALSGRDE